MPNEPYKRGSAEHKLRALVNRPDGWQLAFSKDARRVLSGACGPDALGRFVMPNERTRHEAPVRDWNVCNRACTSEAAR